MRAQLRDSPFDEHVATQGFERNPWLWRSAAASTSLSQITFIWSWVARDGSYRSVFEHAFLNKVLQRAVPIPRGMIETDADLYLRLAAIADVETKTSKAPCRYLGLEIGPNQYEPDPQMWPAGFLGERRTHTNVVYQWQHVRTRQSQHKASCNVTNLLHHGRRVPKHIKPWHSYLKVAGRIAQESRFCS